MEGTNPYGPYQQIDCGFAIGTPVATQNTNVAVVSDVFCCPYPTQLTVKKKCKGLSGAKLEVVDLNSNVVLRVDGPHDSFSRKRVLRDPRVTLFSPCARSVVGTYFDDSAKVYHSNAVIAEVKEKTTFGGFFKGNKTLWLEQMQALTMLLSSLSSSS
ncbi:hypothetical protein Bca52824_025310 [Brassica carinata]|uniref:Uncharacterized protein n=1 Tax=Brassica carinata TaxID=52824 RepID=A0A8X7VMG1_BRACI|nr:hypothetical protein Bca52824_025310 [Brassica carinata]